MTKPRTFKITNKGIFTKDNGSLRALGWWHNRRTNEWIMTLDSSDKWNCLIDSQKYKILFREILSDDV